MPAHARCLREELRSLGAELVNWEAERVDSPSMFIAYALNLADPGADTEVECATLDEALCHLHELVLNELEDPDGARFKRYGLSIDRTTGHQASLSAHANLFEQRDNVGLRRPGTCPDWHKRAAPAW